MNPSLGTENADALERPTPWAFYLALCLLGPLFFVSYLLSLLAPLPLLYLHVGNPRLKQGRLWLAFAFVIGAALCGAVKGVSGSIGFLVLSALPALVLGEILVRRRGPERAIGGAFLAVCLAATVAGFGVARLKGFELLPAARQNIETQVRSWAEQIRTQNPGDLPEQTADEVERLAKDPALIYEELPGIAAAALLLLCTLPCLALVRWNPKGFLRRVGISRDFLRKWRAPEWLVWPALFCGVFLLFPVDYLSAIANNLLKPILLIYFFQGMSILAYFLDSLRLRGPLRVLVYGAGIVFLTPMVVSFGFFDLWFNFRGRSKPPTEEKES